MQELPNALRKNPKVKRFLMLRMRLEMQQRRAGSMFSPVTADSAPADQQETRAYDAIYSQLRRQLTENGLAQEAEQILQYCIAPFGRSAVVRLFTDPRLTLGVPSLWFFAYTALGVLLISAFNWQGYVAALPAIHIALYIYYRKNRDRLRREKINEILTKGIKI